jgi:phosphatidylglycerol:prolipoprotein diacylglycerol transferase
VGFSVFGYEIKYYGIAIAFGMLIAMAVGMYFCKKRKYDDNVPYEIFLIVVPLAVVGARLFFVLFSSDTTILDFFKFRDGGMTIYGGVIFGALAVFLYSRIKRVGFLPVGDLIAPGLLLAQSIGRWGNYFNQEVYGLKVNFDFFPISVYIDEAHALDGIAGYYLAAFFIEGFLNAIGFAFLFIMYFRWKKFGITTAIYLIWYGTVRAVMEPLRMDNLSIGGGNSAGGAALTNHIFFWVSIASILIGVVLLYLIKKGKISQNDERLHKQIVKRV